MRIWFSLNIIYPNIIWLLDFNWNSRSWKRWRERRWSCNWWGIALNIDWFEYLRYRRYANRILLITLNYFCFWLFLLFKGFFTIIILLSIFTRREWDNTITSSFNLLIAMWLGFMMIYTMCIIKQIYCFFLHLGCIIYFLLPVELLWSKYFIWNP